MLYDPLLCRVRTKTQCGERGREREKESNAHNAQRETEQKRDARYKTCFHAIASFDNDDDASIWLKLSNIHVSLFAEQPIVWCPFDNRKTKKNSFFFLLSNPNAQKQNSYSHSEDSRMLCPPLKGYLHKLEYSHFYKRI